MNDHLIRPDETVLLLTRRHPWAAAGKALRSVILFAVLLGIAVLSTRLPMSVPILPLGFLALAVILPTILSLVYILDWLNDYFVVTNQRVIHEERHLLTGAEERGQALLISVQNVNVSRRGAIAEVIGFGDVVISTAGTPTPMVLDQVPTPVRVQQLVLNQMQRLREAGAMPPTPQTVSAPGLIPPPSPYAQQNNQPSRQNSSQRPAQRNFLVALFRAVFPSTRTVEGDRVIYRKHWIVLVGNIWKQTVLFAAITVLTAMWLFGRFAFLNAVPDFVVTAVVFALFIVNSMWWYWGYVDWREDLYVLDNQFVTDIKRRPFWLRELRLQAGLQQIQNVTSRIGGVRGQVFGYGDVLIQTAAEQGSMEFTGVANPTRVSEEILQRVQHFSHSQAVAGQEQQRQMMAQYLAAYDAARNPSSAASSVPLPPPTPLSAQPSNPTNAQSQRAYPFGPPPAPQRIPLSNQQPTSAMPPVTTGSLSNDQPTSAMRPFSPTMPMQPPSRDDLDQTQGNKASSHDTEPLPPLPPL